MELLFSRLPNTLATIDSIDSYFLPPVCPFLLVTDLHLGRKSFIVFIRSLTCYHAYPSCIRTLTISTRMTVSFPSFTLLPMVPVFDLTQFP